MQKQPENETSTFQQQQLLKVLTEVNYLDKRLSYVKSQNL